MAECVIKRVVDAPREVVFRAWTDAEQFKQWWGPNGFTTPVCKMDFRVGGTCHYCMRSPDGKDYWGKNTYVAIDAPKRIVLKDTFSDEEGNKVSPKQYGMNEWPEETQMVVDFEEQGVKTLLTLHLGVTEEVAKSQGALHGWAETLDRFESHLKVAKK